MADFDDQSDNDGKENKPRQQGGFRKDGKPYKEGNTREDGSYIRGKYRLDPANQFQQGNTAAKGRKGSKNLSKLIEEALNQKLTIDGRKQTAQKWVIEGLIRRAIKKSDRAAQILLDKAEQSERARAQKRGLTDAEIVNEWLAQRLAEAANEISDDADADDETPNDGDDVPHDESDDDDQ